MLNYELNLKNFSLVKYNQYGDLILNNKHNNQHNKYYEPEVISVLGIVVCLLGTLFYFYEYYLRVIPGVIRTDLKLAYNITDASFGFLVGLYYWAYVPLQLVVGLFMDLLGPRIALTIACLISALGIYLFAGTPYLLVAQIGRFLVGFGAAFAYVGVLKLANMWLPKKLFAFVAGLCSTLGMLGGISGQIVIAKGVGLYGWQYTSYISGIVGIIFSLLLWLFIREPKNANKIKSLENNKHRFHRQLKILSKELKQVIKLKDLWLAGIIGCLTFAGLSVFADVWSASFLKLAGIPKNLVGFSSAMIYIGFGIGAPIWGIFSDFINRRKLLLTLGSLIAAILISIIIYFPMSLCWTNICLFLFGFFIGVEILVFAIINYLCHKEITATAMGFVNMLIMLGGFYLQPKIGIILDYLNKFEELVKFKIALTVLPAGLIIASVLSLFLTKDRVLGHTKN